MLLWNLYFLIKFGLHFAGQLTLSPLWNLGLFALLIATNPAAYQNKQLMKVLRYLVFTGPAIALLLHELGLVVSLALVDQIKALFGFSLDYLWELLKRTIQPWMLWSALLVSWWFGCSTGTYALAVGLGLGLCASSGFKRCLLFNNKLKQVKPRLCLNLKLKPVKICHLPNCWLWVSWIFRNCE